MEIKSSFSDFASSSAFCKSLRPREERLGSAPPVTLGKLAKRSSKAFASASDEAPAF
jgi:hypothetical protein